MSTSHNGSNVPSVTLGEAAFRAIALRKEWADQNSHLSFEDWLCLRVSRLERALVYSAHALRFTPQHQLPPGLLLGDANFVRVTFAKGDSVEATWAK